MTDKPEQNPTHKGLYSALAAAQAEMGRAVKDATNPAFKSKYADLASVMNACMPALSRHGIAVLQPPFDDETGRYVKTIFVHGDSGETAECRVPLIIGKNDMQGYGSAATYARRYGLMGMAGIAADDDDGNTAVIAAPKPEAKRQPAEPDNTIPNTIFAISKAATPDALTALWNATAPNVRTEPTVKKAFADRGAALKEPTPPADLGQDEIPY